MTKVTLLNLKGEKIEDIKLNDEVFGITPNKSVLYDAIILARASLRQGTHDTKTRSEVRGGGRKPWRQKGTGHARQGSIRAVQWRGGGIAFGPTPRDYSIKQNRKERRLALKSAVVDKLEDFVVVDKLALSTPKTKEMQNILNTLKLNEVNTLVIVNELDENLILASRNIPNILLIDVTEVNVLDLVAATKVLVTKDALKSLEEVLK
ncbi:MAG: 50S ribosomal protein L4 [Bacilli bacterium]|nr:50S ribosomal protein L4 [Bacilli bacterium]